MVSTEVELSDRVPKTQLLRLGLMQAPAQYRNRVWSEEGLRACLVTDIEASAEMPKRGVLFEADVTLQRAMISPRAMGFGRLPTLQDWESVTDALFAPRLNVHALLSLSRSSVRQLDLWLALPYPFEHQTDFGVLSGRHVDFSRVPEDRVVALTDWIDRVLEHWQEAVRQMPDHRVCLQGFAWTRGLLWGTDRAVLERVAQHLHNMDLKLLWCKNQQDSDFREDQDVMADVTLIRPRFRADIQNDLFAVDGTVVMVERPFE